MNNPFIIKKPWITEKSASLAQQGRYVFLVDSKATKSEVKKAVKELYKVDVSKVNITVKHRRAKGLSGRRGISPALRKAVVQVKEGQKIDFV